MKCFPDFPLAAFAEAYEIQIKWRDLLNYEEWNVVSN